MFVKRKKATMTTDEMSGQPLINGQPADKSQFLDLLKSGGYWESGQYHGTIEYKQEQATPKNKR